METSIERTANRFTMYAANKGLDHHLLVVDERPKPGAHSLGGASAGGTWNR